MRNIKIWSLLAILTFALAGCKNKGTDDPQPPQPGPGELTEFAQAIVKQWRISSFCDEVIKDFDIYVEFKADGTFEMYQRLYTLNYEYFSGTYNIEGDILTGSYDDGQNWKCGYKGEVSSNGMTLTLYSQEDVSTKSVFASTLIPEDVKTEATRSADAPERFF